MWWNCCWLKLKWVLIAMLVLAAGAAAQSKPARVVPPVWTPSYNASQGALPDTSDWKVVRQEKNLVVRLAPGSDWSQYREVAPGEVRYTGSEIKLRPRQIADVTESLQTRLDKDLRRVKLTPAARASSTLKVDANITDAMTSSLANAPAAAVSMAPAGHGRANVTAWLFDDKSKKPVACIEMSSGDEGFEWVWGFGATGRIRAALKAQSKTLAQVLSQMDATGAGAKMKKHSSN